MKVKRAPKIFISYRRHDTAGFARMLKRDLEAHFGMENVFFDSDIPSGNPFKLTIKDEIAKSDILLAVIGSSWLAKLKEKLANNDDDYVRWEIATALLREPKMVVMPVLVEGVPLPSQDDLPEDLKGLLDRNKGEISSRWLDHEVTTLILHLENEFKGIPRTKTNPRNTRLGFYGGVVAALLSGTVIGVTYTLSTSSEWWRPLLVAGFAFVVGVLMSGFISYGIDRFSSWRNSSRLSKLLGSMVGGTVGGASSAIVGVWAFSFVEGPLVPTLPVAGAVIVSNVVVAGGMLLPELRTGGEQRTLALIALPFASLMIFFAAAYLLKQHHEFVAGALRGGSYVGGLIVGSAAGFLSGIQIGSVLFKCSPAATRGLKPRTG